MGGLLQAAGVPSSLVRSFGEVEKHPQSEVRKMFPVLNHPVAGLTESRELR